MQILAHIPAWLKNKYVLTVLGFVVWMLFFDDRDFYVTCIKQRQELANLQKSVAYYSKLNAETRKELDQLKINAFTIEKYSREKFLMKRDNEDLFVIQPATPAK